MPAHRPLSSRPGGYAPALSIIVGVVSHPSIDKVMPPIITLV